MLEVQTNVFASPNLRLPDLESAVVAAVAADY